MPVTKLALSLTAFAATCAAVVYVLYSENFPPKKAPNHAPEPEKSSR